MATAGGGFDAVFVEALSERLTCSICQLALKEPKLTECGHHFCNSCLTSCLQTQPFPSCPMCRTELAASKTFPNNALKREILDLKIKCDRHEKGCGWVGELRNREDHDKQCEYIGEECDNKCGVVLIRKDMKYHKKRRCPRRKVGCEHCVLSMESMQLQDHYKECPLCPVACVYICGETLPRCQMAEHIGRQGTCPESPLDCDFMSTGCQFEGKRSQLMKHLESNTASHLRLVARELTRKLDNCNQELQTTKQKMGGELAAIRDELASTREELAEKGGELAATRDELAATKQKLVDTQYKLASVETQHVEEMIRRHFALPPHPPNQFIHMWRIENWPQKVLDAKSYLESIESDPFYVFPGYHLSIRAYPNGYKCPAVPHLSVYLCTEIGDFDQRVKWPFPFSFVLEVMDQQSDGQNISCQPYGQGLQRPISFPKGSGSQKIASHSTLKSRCYVKDDAILIRLTLLPEARKRFSITSKCHDDDDDDDRYDLYD